MNVIPITAKLEDWEDSTPMALREILNGCEVLAYDTEESALIREFSWTKRVPWTRLGAFNALERIAWEYRTQCAEYTWLCVWFGRPAETLFELMTIHGHVVSWGKAAIGEGQVRMHISL
jgi:hypothetical protein